MKASTSASYRRIRIGAVEVTHNQFLMMLALIAALAFSAANWIGAPTTSSLSLIDNLMTPQMVWGLLLLPVGAAGAWVLNSSGHRDTAVACAIVAGGFLCGAVQHTFSLW